MDIGEYKTAHGNSVKELDAQVNHLIKEGFQPFGNPYFSDREVEGRGDTFGVWQAMVRDKDYLAKNPRANWEKQ